MDVHLDNWRGGLGGIAIFLLVWAVMYILAFMTAFGNDSATARGILAVFQVFSGIANPVWGIPLSYCAGSCLLLRSAKNRKTGL